MFILTDFSHKNIEQQGRYFNAKPNPYNMDWVLKTIRQRAAHIREFETKLCFNTFVLSQVVCQELNRRARNALTGLMFNQYT